MNKLSGFALSIGLALIPAQAMASAYTHGTACVPTSGALGCLEYDRYGVHNTCSSAVTVDCPLTSVRPAGDGINIYQMYVYMYDRNSSADVSCSIQQTDVDGSIIYSVTMGTSGSKSGLYMNHADLNIDERGWWHAQCSIPAPNASGGYSHVVGFFAYDG